MTPEKKRMGSMSRLSAFGKTAATPQQPQSTEPDKQIRAEIPKASQESSEEKLVAINIKIRRSQQDWLSNTARQVRDNNLDPVQSGDRVYPQHLIQVAIDLLQSTELDWAEIKNVEDLRKAINLSGD